MTRFPDEPLPARGVPSRAGDDWTQADDSRLIALWRRGVSDVGIGASIGRSAKAVKHRRGLLRLVKPCTRVDRTRLLALHAEGKTTEAIAVELGATPRTVQELRWRELRHTGKP